MITNLGYKVSTVHPKASAGYRFLAVRQGDTVHWDEFIPAIGKWMYVGFISL